MFLEDPPRARAGLRAALGLAAIALGQHDKVGVFPFADDLATCLRPQSGRARILTFARRMAELEPGGATDLARAVQRLGALRLRGGLAVVLSDFFDPRGAAAVVEALKQVRHRLLLVQLVRRTDRQPDLVGDLRLADCESGAVEDVSVTPAVIARYRESYDRFQATLADFARKRGHGLLRLDADLDVVPQLGTLFETGSLAV
jgi:uncharacterized protein (DUF58 family)